MDIQNKSVRLSIGCCSRCSSIELEYLISALTFHSMLLHRMNFACTFLARFPVTIHKSILRCMLARETRRHTLLYALNAISFRIRSEMLSANPDSLAPWLTGWLAVARHRKHASTSASACAVAFPPPTPSFPTALCAAYEYVKLSAVRKAHAKRHAPLEVKSLLV